jgi:hypothetical protein
MSGLFDTGAAPAKTLDQQDQMLIQAYVAAGRTLDDLPYTPEFEQIFIAVGGEQSGRDRRAVFHRLHNLRKAKKLPRLGKASELPPHILPEDETLLAALVVERVGTMGQRDQLPYDQKFDDLVQVFAARSGRGLSLRDVWRVVAKLAK